MSLQEHYSHRRANPRNRVQHVNSGFFALCILSIDFKIYFFFKLVYGEKRRAKPRRLPPFPCPSNHSSPLAAFCSHCCSVGLPEIIS